MLNYDIMYACFGNGVTVCNRAQIEHGEPYESSMENMEWYDKFYNFILKHVEFVEKTGECSCVVNWYKFIKDNMETFRECAMICGKKARFQMMRKILSMNG